MAEKNGADRRRRDKAAGPAPTSQTLRDAALAHLARYGSTEAGLARVLARRVERWARTAREADGSPETADMVAQATEAARAAIGGIVRALAAAGAVDDAAFAQARARRLNRAGRSRRAVASHLAARGIAPEVVRALPATPEDELAAAVALARRRRIGPYRVADDDAAIAQKELGMLARAGFSRDVAEQALRMDRGEAEALVLQLRQS